MDGLPELAGVEHRYVTTRDGVRIHVAEAGPSGGSPIMLVHGFPQHWWEWHHQIGPLAADGYRVIVPDLRGAGWSDAPRGRYPKADVGEDLVAVLDELGVDRVRIAAHDWGGPPAFILLLRHPERVGGFFGINTVAPLLKLDGPNALHFWSFWYQYVLACPGLGPRLIGSPTQRYLRFLVRWVGGGWTWPEDDADIYLRRMRDPARAYAGSQYYRTFQTGEMVNWLRGEYAGIPVDVPVRFLMGLRDPVVTPTLLRGYERTVADFEVEHVPGLGHWIIEQAPELVLGRLRSFLSR